MKKILLFLACYSPSLFLFSQEPLPDSVKLLDEVTVRSFEQNKAPDSTAIAVHIINTNEIDRHNKTSLVSGMNTIAGLRMEERSPGSYRLNIRGSSLRSPFGVRNIKLYWNEMPITDAGGNTYLNQFALNNFSSIEIFKGPAGSLYGAGTGGLVIMNTLNNWVAGTSFEYLAGSYQLHNFFGSVSFGKKENRNLLTYAHNQSDGYRVQSALRRDNFSWTSQVKISAKQELTAALLFTDMYYQTPGALTLSEFIAEPGAARPAAGIFPSAVNARAAIFQKNLTAGFTNTFHFSSSFRNLTSFFGTFSQVKNPAIRNYERRNEPGAGLRSVFSFSGKSKNNSWQVLAGTEIQKGWFNTRVANNRNGNPDTIQSNDDIDYSNISLFTQLDAVIGRGWIVNAGISLNRTHVEFIRLSRYPVIKQERTYQNELAPRFALRKNIGSVFYALASVSRGFSPPTIAELLPSTGQISTHLEAEYGWNYELSTGVYLLDRKLKFIGTGFIFRLNNTLVQRRDSSGADFFINAGNTKQDGLEISSEYSQFYQHSAWIERWNSKASFTYHPFRYGNFIKGTDNFSGKQLPSVPVTIFSFMSDLQFKKGIYSQASFYTASKIFLNDANTVSAGDYQLLGWRLGWNKQWKSKYKLNIYAGVENILNEVYSLGHDINAAGGRYYNAAPGRNYYLGVALQWLSTSKN